MWCVRIQRFENLENVKCTPDATVLLQVLSATERCWWTLNFYSLWFSAKTYTQSTLTCTHTRTLYGLHVNSEAKQQIRGDICEIPFAFNRYWFWILHTTHFSFSISKLYRFKSFTCFNARAKIHKHSHSHWIGIKQKWQRSEETEMRRREKWRKTATNRQNGQFVCETHTC